MSVVATSVYVCGDCGNEQRADPTLNSVRVPCQACGGPSFALSPVGIDARHIYVTGKKGELD